MKLAESKMFKGLIGVLLESYLTKPLNSYTPKFLLGKQYKMRKKA